MELTIRCQVGMKEQRGIPGVDSGQSCSLALHFYIPTFCTCFPVSTSLQFFFKDG